MSTVLTKPVLLDETGQAIVGKLDEIKEAIDNGGTEKYPVLIHITTMPTKTSYIAGEQLNLAGMVVKAVFSNNVEYDVTDQCTFSPANGTVLTSSDTSVTATYTWHPTGTSFTATQAIEIASVSGINITTPPTKTLYKIGELIDYSGIVVKATYTNGVEIDVTNDCSFYPLAGSTYAITTDHRYVEVTVSYVDPATSETFTTSMRLNWNELSLIKVVTPPTKTSYDEGDPLDLSGLVVHAVFLDESESDITNACTTIPANGAEVLADVTSIEINYVDPDSFGGTTYTTSTPITVIEALVYGVEWQGTASSAWVRTGLAADFTDPVAAINNGNGSSPFDNIMPWSGMERVNDPDAGMLVKIPKFYYKWTKNGNTLKLEISQRKKAGFHTSPAHADRGDGQGERNNIYVGAYHCVSGYTSTSGAKPKVSETIDSFRTNIHALGSDIWQWDYATYMTIAMLYLVEYADWNSQKVIGEGLGNGSSSTNNGATDGMVYHTGSSAGRTGQGHVRYRYIEDLWANVNDFLDGIYGVQGSTYEMLCNLDPSEFDDTSKATSVAISFTTDHGIPSAWNVANTDGFEFIIMPAGVIPYNDVSNNTQKQQEYTCDMYYGATINDRRIAQGGDFYSTNTQYGSRWSIGLFQIKGNSSASSTSDSKGARLMKLPANT